MEQNLILFNK